MKNKADIPFSQYRIATYLEQNLDATLFMFLTQLLILQR
jgi:hypothetical protein